MILVDASVWIEWLGGRGRMGDADPVGFATCGPVLQEVLQGLRPGARSEGFRQAMLAVPVLSDPLPQATFLAAAEIFRQGRARGLTIRSAVDCLIAAIAIENQVCVWHRDRDYSAIAQYTNLQHQRLG